MAISAPSFANKTATALPIPLSPPVINAILFASLPDGLAAFSTLGTGTIFDSLPGRLCDCGFLNGRFFPAFCINNLSQHVKI
jgi:hypothetical protein